MGTLSDRNLSRQRIATALAFLVSGLVSAHCLGLFSRYVLGHDTVLGLVPLFNMDLQGNVPWFFSSALFVLGSAGFYALHRQHLQNGEGRHWLVMAIVFMCLAVDNAFGLHLRLTGPVRDLLDTSGFFYFAWIIPYAVATGLLAVYVLPQFLSLPAPIRGLLSAAAAAYLLGALVLAGVEGFYGQVYEALPASERGAYADMLAYDVVEAVKDTLELAGLAILVYTQARLLHSGKRG